MAPRIALFGTSADPPHRGHQAILLWLATQFDHVAVWTADNPYKQHQSSLQDRFRMLELMVGDLPVEPGRICLYQQLGHRRSIVSIEQAQTLWPGAQLTFVVGADLVAQLPRWYRSQDIFAAVGLLIIPRPGYGITQEDLGSLRGQGATVEVATPPAQHDVSSSHFRQTENEDDLPPVIQAYIDRHQLYSCRENSRETQLAP